MSYRRNHRRNNNRNHRRNNPNKKFSIGKRTSHVTTYAKDNEHPERTIRRFLRKCKKEKVIETFRDKTGHYRKPSVTKRRKKLRKEAMIKKQNQQEQK